MTKTGLRGFAAGIFISCALLAIYTYILHPFTGQTKQANAVLTTEQVDQFLAQKGQIAIDQATFDKWSHDQKSSASTKKDTKSGSPSKSKASASSSHAPTVTKMTINVTSSMGVWDVAKELEASHIIKNKQTLYDYMLHHHLDKHLQLGSFTVSSDMTTKQVANTLTKH